MIVGIPRALYYHSYSYLWKTFFDNLKVEYIISPKTNKDILKKGKILSTDETCLPAKIYLGHIDYLKDKCDYVLVPRYLGVDKINLSCIKFNSMYDIVKNTFKNIKTIDYNIDYIKGCKIKNEFIKMGKKLGFKSNVASEAFDKSYKEFNNYRMHEFELQESKVVNSELKKVLILSHSYNIEDEMIGKKISNILISNDIEVILSSKFISNEDKSTNISKTLYWDSSRQILNSLEYYKNRVDGIILLTSFPCGNDCLVNELIIRKLKNYKIVNIVIDEVNASAGLVTRLESFIDIINGITI